MSLMLGRKWFSNKMIMKKKKVLLFEGYARQVLPYLKAFKDMDYETTVIFNSRFDIAYFSRFVDFKILTTCEPSKFDESEKNIIEIIKKGKYDLVVPMGDFAAIILSKNKEELEKYANIAVNSWDKLSQAIDKNEVMRTCMANEISCPHTYLDCTSIGALRLAKYPLVVKPVSESGARGLHICNSYEELKSLNLRDLERYVFQEYIPMGSKNYSASLYIDKDGELKNCVIYRSIRWYPHKGGTGTLNVYEAREEIKDICLKLARIMGLKGIVGFDLIEDPRDKNIKVLEINPRILACAKISFCVGVNNARDLNDEYFLGHIDYTEAREIDLKVRMTQIDILWLLKSKEGLRKNFSWFSQKNTIDQTFSIRDPIPWFSFLIGGILRLKKELRIRS